MGLNKYNGSYGECYISTPGATTIATQNVAVAAAGTTTAGPLRGFTHTSPGKLTYTAPQPADFMVNITAILDTAVNAKTFSVAVGINGTIQVAAETQQAIAATTAPEVFSSSYIVALTVGDYIQIMVENVTDNANVTLDQGSLIVTRL